MPMYQHVPDKWNCVQILQCGFNQKVLGTSFQIDNVEGSSTKKSPSFNIIVMYLEEIVIHKSYKFEMNAHMFNLV
jgi:hypothetical protein